MNIKIIAVGSSWWERFIRRWGVSFLIGEDILFDTFGNPWIFLRNIARYNIDLSKIKHIVISHDDWDHISGLWYVINRYKDLSVYICPNFKLEIKERIKSFSVNVIEAKEGLKIKEGIYTTGELEGESKGEIIYEQSLVIKSSKGLVVVTGCAHPGITNIVNSVKKQFNEDVYFIIGGLHLKDVPIEEAIQVIRKLKQSGVERIAPMHCTGKKTTQFIKEAFNVSCVETQKGSSIEV